MTTFVLDREENILEKGVDAGYKHFLLLPQCFHKPAFSELFKVGFCLGMGTSNRLIEYSIERTIIE